MKILFAASECWPIVKIGGLGDVIGSLPKTLKNFGQDVRIVIPKYEMVNEKKWNLRKIFSFYLEKEKIILWQGFLPKSKVILYLLENKNYLSQGEVYLPINKFESLKRFLFFSRAILELFKNFPWQPQIIHCHDWQTAILPMLSKLENQNFKFLLTIHNLANQGKWQGKEVFNFLNLKGNEIESLKIRDKDGDFNILQQGILTADILTTVSPNYSKEILTKKRGENLEEILRKRKKELFGILNGIDTEIFNPETDPNLKANYSLKNFKKKIENKIDLQKILKLPTRPQIPLMGFIGRLTYQKGIWLFEKILPNLGKMNCQIIFLGVGEKKFEEMIFGFSRKYPKNISANIKFDPLLAQKIYGGCDIILIPSIFEPCGLIQMIAQRYGTIPVARKTGGLVDTIEDGKTGFLFKKFTPESFLRTIKKCLKVFKNKKIWQKMIKLAMAKDFSWQKSAKKYLKIYQKLL